MKRGTVTPINDPIFSMKHLLDPTVLCQSCVTTNDGTLTGYVSFEPKSLLTAPQVDVVDISSRPINDEQRYYEEWRKNMNASPTKRLLRKPYSASNGILGTYFADAMVASKEFSAFVHSALQKAKEADKERHHIRQRKNGVKSTIDPWKKRKNGVKMGSSLL